MGRRLGVLIVAVALVSLSVQRPALAASGKTDLCSGFSACSSAGYSNYGYASVYTQKFWGQDAGHNCTNYVGYRFSALGISRPSWASGGAKAWGKQAPSGIVTHKPRRGAIAWWNSSAPYGTAGHVGIVQRVNSDGSIVTSEDGTGTGWHWRKYVPGGTYWPTAFIHLADTRLSPASSTGRFDWNGDGKSDLAIYRPSDHTWHIDWTHDRKTDGIYGYGANGDIPMSMDWNGDGKSDLAIYRPSDHTWHIDWTHDRKTDGIYRYGANGDIPMSMDWNGDGKSDLAIYRRSDHTWHIDWTHDQKTDGVYSYGATWDVPLSLDWNNDGKSDLAIWRPSEHRWYIDWTRDRKTDGTYAYGAAGDVPVSMDWNGDGRSDLAVYRASDHTWHIDWTRDRQSDGVYTYGAVGDLPLGTNRASAP